MFTSMKAAFAFANLAGLILVPISPVRVVAQTLVSTLPVGSYPVAINVNSVTKKIYVVNQRSNNVTVIDGLTYRTATVPTGALPTAVAVNSVTNKIYVTNGNGNSVTVIDGATDSISTVAVGSYPAALAVNTVTNQIYVANYSSNTLTAIDGATRHTTNINLGQHPTAVAVNEATNEIYVADYGSNDVAVIDGSTHATTLVPVGFAPRAVAVNEFSNQIYAADFRANAVSVIDGATLGVTPVNVGTGPIAIALDAAHNRIYVANSGTNTGTVIDATTFATTTVTLGNWPSSITADPITNKAYFANSDQPGSVTMVNGSDYSTVNLTVGAYPSAIALDPASNVVYVANEMDDTVSIIAGASSDPLQFMPLAPCRVADTRLVPGPFGGPAIAGGTSRSFPLPQGGCNIPSAAIAYSLNVTVVPNGVLNYLTMWPAGEPQPLISTLNSGDGRVKANAAIVPAGVAGAIDIFASDTTNIVLDINGYFQAANGLTLQFYPLTPCRVLDTRQQHGYLGGPYLRGTRERDFPIQTSNCQIPSAAQSYSLIFTVVPWQGESLGYLSVWAAGGNQPVVSTLNNPTATIVANAAIVPAGVDGAIAVYPDQNTQLVADINGYFAAPGPGGLSLYSSAPCRVLDTRSNGGAFSGERNPPVNVGANHCGIPDAAQAYVFNATVVPVGSLGYLTLWPDGLNMPLASTLNATDGMITSNMAVLPNQDGQIDAYASGVTQLILDISSYFAP